MISELTATSKVATSDVRMHMAIRSHNEFFCRALQLAVEEAYIIHLPTKHASFLFAQIPMFAMTVKARYSRHRYGQ